MIVRFICFIIAVLLNDVANSANSIDFLDEIEAKAFLKSYGYMKNKNGFVGTRILSADDGSEENLRNAIKDFQYNHNLAETGIMDNITKAMMSRPRCGVKDTPSNRHQQNKRYHIEGSKWDKTHLTWRLLSTKPIEIQEKIRRDLFDAFQVWQNATVFSFEEFTDRKSDIVVEFFRLDHGDDGPFDGPGRTIAHAFYPYSGEMHFDNDETWNFGRDAPRNRRGSSFFDAAVHQIGHILGLGHSIANKSVMFPSMVHESRYFELSQDEIDGIAAIYGTTRITTAIVHVFSPLKNNINTTTNTSELVTQSSIPDFCNMSYDAISSYRGDIFIFKDEYVWRVGGSGVMHGYPILIRKVWSSLPIDFTRLDAVYENHDGKLLMYTKQKFYRFNGNRFESYGSLSDLGISGNVTHIDAIFIWSKTNDTFIFSGDNFWKFNETTQKVLQGYPKPTSRVWKKVGLFDAAFTLNTSTYFFKGLEYFEFDDRFLKLSDIPKRSAKYWMMCSDSRL